MIPGETDPRTARTRQYTHGAEPVLGVRVSANSRTAETPLGQMAILSAVNMIARVHPSVQIDVPASPLVVSSLAGGRDLLESASLLASAANPSINVLPAQPRGVALPSIGVGPDAPTCSIYVGARRWTALMSSQPQPIEDASSSALGLAMAISQACGSVFRLSISLPAASERRSSLWTLSEAAETSGPADLSPLDVGSVWIVGAGAVGSALAWWAHFLDLAGAWSVIDADDVDASNLNRCLPFFATHAGLTGQPPESKAKVLSDLLPNASAVRCWWDEFVASDPYSPDVIVPVANDFGVRPAIAAYGHPAVIHTATSPNWTAELHRHLVRLDDCIGCRLPEAAPRFQCATATDIRGDDVGSSDAALPFLSGAAGALALAALGQLQHGNWPLHTRNHWRWWFDESPKAVSSSRWSCQASCTATPAPLVRNALHSHTRWRDLDPDAATGV